MFRPMSLTALALALVMATPSALVAAGGAVINEHGISVKLITTRDCQLHESPDASSASAPCAVFSYWYVLPPDGSAPSRRLQDLDSLTENGFYRVAAGDSEGEFKGWIHRDDAVEWHHRQAVRFAKRTGRGLAYFYPDEASAVEAATSGGNEGATHREPRKTGGNLILMPLLDAKPVTVAGAEMSVYDVAFMSGAATSVAGDSPPGTVLLATPGSAPDASAPDAVFPEDELTQETVRAESTADIVFVLDTTGSMGPPIRQVLASITRVVEELAANPAVSERLRFGLVAYRDEGDAYISRVLCDLEEGKDHGVFIQRLATTQVAGGGDYPEDVLAGVARAIDPDAMKWNPFAWKQLVIVGDSSMKGPDHPIPEFQNNEGGRTIAAMKAKLQPGSGSAQELMAAGFVVTAVRIQNPDGADDQPIGDAQFSTLVEGRTYDGNLVMVRGGGQADDFSDQLAESILTRLENYNVAVIEGQGRVAAEPGVEEADFPFPVLDLLESLPGEESDAASMRFASRYCTEFDADGNRQFVPHVFIRKGQLKSFNSMLEFLQGTLEDAGEPGSRDVGQILRSLQVVSTTLNLAEPIAADMPIDRFLQVILGLPLKTPVFQVSISDLAAMSQTDYDDWVRSVKSHTETIDTLIENPNIWYKLHPTAGEREEHAFVALADLP